MSNVPGKPIAHMAMSREVSMYPRTFDYEAPKSLGDALDVLAEKGDEARVLAGGQSLAGRTRPCRVNR